MEVLNFENNKIHIDWASEDITDSEIDEFVNKFRAVVDPDEWLTMDVVYFGKSVEGRVSLMEDISDDEFKRVKVPDEDKPVRLRAANHINYITRIYDTLRKLNFAINLNLKEDIVSETIIYFMHRWDKYEYHPRCIPIAVQKYKSINIDIYRKEKKQVNINDEEFDGYLPQSLDAIEGLPLKELEKKEDFKRIKEAIFKMDDEMCREILMYVADDKSESEIQKILDIPLGTVSSRKSNCIKKLAEIMKI